MNYRQLLIGVAVGVIAALGIGFLVSSRSMSASSLGANVVGVGQVQTNTFWFYNGLFAGTSQQWKVTGSGNMTVNNVRYGSSGFSGSYSTSTALTASQFCASTNDLWTGTSALATATLPSSQSAYAQCGSDASFGSWHGGLVTNDSTNTVNYVAGASTTFRCETSGIGTTTVIGGCTSSQVSLNATSTAQVSWYWDNSSSSLVILWGNMFH